MKRGRRYQAVRWVGGVLAALLGILVLVLTAQFVPAYLADQSLTNKAGYLGAIMGAVSLLIVLVQFVRWLGRRERPHTLAERLQAEIREELVHRLDHLRRTSENISLAYRSATGRTEASLEALAERLLHGRARIVVTGHPGRGKSYSSLQIALEVIRSDPTVVPLVVPLSQWTEDEEITAWLSRFVTTEFGVSARSASELIGSGSVLALFDGLDELCGGELSVGPAELFLERLVEWRLHGAWAPFLLTCRRDTWNAVREDLRAHYTLDTYAVLPVRYDQAITYLSRSLGRTETFGPAVELAQSLQAEDRGHVLASPWQLSLVAELARNRLRAGAGDHRKELITVVESADTASLVARYVESASAKDAFVLSRLLNVLDLWWLSNYAKHLERSRSEQTTLAAGSCPPETSCSIDSGRLLVGGVRWSWTFT